MMILFMQEENGLKRNRAQRRSQDHCQRGGCQSRKKSNKSWPHNEVGHYMKDCHI